MEQTQVIEAPKVDPSAIIQKLPAFQKLADAADAEADAIIATIVDEDTANAASLAKNRMKRTSEDWTGFCDAPIKSAHSLHRWLTGLRGIVTTPLDAAAKKIGDGIVRWQQVETRKRQKEADERNAKIRAEEEKQRLDHAAALEKAGEKEAANQVLDTPMPTPKPMAAPVKVAGTSFRTLYSAEVTDAMALIQAVAAGTVPLSAIVPNMTFLNNQARQLKDQMRYPGVRCVASTVDARSGS